MIYRTAVTKMSHYWNFAQLFTSPIEVKNEFYNWKLGFDLHIYYVSSRGINDIQLKQENRLLQDEIEFIPILTPKFIINQEFSYSLKNFTINLSARYQSQSYINFENSESLNDYFIINGRIDYKFKNYFASFFMN